MTAAVLQRAPDIIAQSRPRRRSLKRPAMFAAALIISAGAAYYGHKWWTVDRFFESTDDAYVGGDVTVMAPKVSGFINQVAVTDNQVVHAGDLLIRLDDRDYRAALARAEAMVAGQRATLANLDATRRLQQSLIAQAQAGIAAADAETVRARDDQARFQTLARTAAASLQSFQAADADYKKALAGAEKARATLDAAQRQLDVIDTQKQQTQAALEAALADRDTAGLNLSYTELRAPFDGTIGNRSARTGAFAGVGSQLLAVVPARGLWVDANFKENQLAHMRPGEPVTHPRRCPARRSLPRSCRQPCSGHGRTVQRAAGGERDRQLHQDRAAGAGTHPTGRRRVGVGTTASRLVRGCRCRPATRERGRRAATTTTAREPADECRHLGGHLTPGNQSGSNEHGGEGVCLCDHVGRVLHRIAGHPDRFCFVA